MINHLTIVGRAIGLIAEEHRPTPYIDDDCIHFDERLTIRRTLPEERDAWPKQFVVTETDDDCETVMVDTDDIEEALHYLLTYLIGNLWCDLQSSASCDPVETSSVSSASSVVKKPT